MDIERLKSLANIAESKDSGYYYSNIESDTLNNTFYRRVLFTAPSIQLVLMSIPPGEEIGEEIHEKVDQFIRVESGQGSFIISREEISAVDGDAVVIPQGTRHNLINTGDTELKVYAIYSPPEHDPGTAQKIKP